MSDYITEVLKNKMIPFGVINGKRKNLSKFNPNHDELGRFTSGSGSGNIKMESAMRFGNSFIDPSVIDVKSVESKKIKGMVIHTGMIGNKPKESYAKYTSPKNGVTYDIISDNSGNTDAYVEGKPQSRVSKLEIIVDALGQGKHEIYEVNTTNSHLRQGLASAMFEVSRTLLGGEFTPNALTAQGSKWWESISKFNPNHDELGRFTFASGNRTISAKPKMSRRALGLKGKVSSIIRFSSEERKAAVEKLATEGSSKLLMPPDANGIAQVLPQGAADKRYGKTVAQIKKSIAKLGVESVAVTPEFAKGKNARRQMQATAQALEEAKAMGIPIDKLTMRFTTALRDADGSYAGDENQRAGDIMLDYTDDRRAKFIADKIANDSGPRILNAPTVAQTEFTSDYPAVTSQTDLVAKYTYGVAVHEIGHHYTYINVNNPNAKRQFGLETPARYGTSDVYEMLAEGFTAWWLLGRSRVKSTQTFYKRWLPFVKVVLNGNDTGFGIPTPEALLKAMVRKTKVLNLLTLSPTHPLMVYLTDGASIPDDIEKFNPNHDELGRFTFASAGGRKVGGVERKKIKPTRRKILQNKKTKRETGESGIEEYVVGDGKEIIAKNFGIKTLVKAGVLSEEDYLWCVNTYIHEMGFYGTEDSAMKRIGLTSNDFQSGKIDDDSVFYKIVAQKQLSNALKAKMSGKEMSDAVTSLSTLHKRMTDAREIRIYGGLSQFVGGKDGKTSYANEELNNIGDSIYDTFSEFIISGWAGSSGRDVSLMMSSYAEALLKAEGTYQQNGYEQVFSKAVWYFNTGIGERALDKLLRTSVQGIYDNTQKVLDSQGVTHVRVYRGYEDQDGVTIGNKPIVDRISTRPLASCIEKYLDYFGITDMNKLKAHISESQANYFWTGVPQKFKDILLDSEKVANLLAK
jgi:hypothetical protein